MLLELDYIVVVVVVDVVDSLPWLTFAICDKRIFLGYVHPIVML